MTNWKESGGKNRKSSESEKNQTKTKPQQEWKKVETITEVVSALKRSTKERRKPKYGTTIYIRAKRYSATRATEPGKKIVPELEDTLSLSQVADITNENKEISNQNEADKNSSHENESADESTSDRSESSVISEETKTRVTAKVTARRSKGRSRTALKQEPEEPEEDAISSFKHSVYEAIKNAFGLAYGDDKELKFNVDNIFPLLKTLGLNPHSERVVDLVRESSIERFGEIDTSEFEDVVLNMVKEKDEELWIKRLEEKEHLHHEREAARATAEAEKFRLEHARAKAGFKKEDENTDEWAEYERKKKEEEDKREKEMRDDELYDNMKMAFKFIDADDDGVISTQDLYVLMMGMGEMLTDDELFGMVNMADTDCDGKVTLEDFKKFLLPISGNESLIVSPAALAQQHLQSQPIIVDSSGNSAKTQEAANESAASDRELDDSPLKLVSDNTQPSVDNTQKEAEKSKEPGVSEEEKARIEKRKKSMLWGYMSSAKSSTDSRQVSLSSISSIDDEVFKDKSIPNTPDTQTKILIDSKEDSEGVDEERIEQTVQEAAGSLHAIREEDEHSNYDIDHNDNKKLVANDKQEAKFISALESKRKVFSRQSSSASLTKNTDSFGDSGVETMDSVNCSEIRDQPDVFDLSDIGDEDGARTPHVTENSSSAVYNNDEDDEDMIDPLHVHESLSRVSSSESLAKLDLDSELLLPSNDSEGYTEERVMNFVNEHTYMEIEPIPPEPTKEEIERINEMKRRADQKINKAKHLEQAILQRSFTVPSLTMYKSHIERPQTARPSANGINCSHIDIDLSCEAPPKAEIKSYRMFTERVKSARSSRREKLSSNDKSRMSVIDICNSINTEESTSNTSSRQKWPMRPLTRPRSPIMRRVFSPSEKQFSLDLETDELGRENSGRKNPRQRRARSAVCARRSQSPSLMISGESRKIERPKTALPYTKSKLENDEKRAVLVVEPLANADELYPNKSALTTYHHGFKSIWPIGRKINMIQAKRPFRAFEMNSYSRSIERCQFPFKGNNNVKIVTKLDEPFNRITTPKIVGKNVIKLEMETEKVKKPAIRKLSLYITPNSTPRAVR